MLQHRQLVVSATLVGELQVAVAVQQSTGQHAASSLRQQQQLEEDIGGGCATAPAAGAG